MFTHSRSNVTIPLLMLAMFSLAACDNDDDDDGMTTVPPPPPPPPAMASFEVTVMNLTNAQPLSPAGIIAHDDSYSVFQLGSPVSPGLEELAEGGDNTALLDEATAAAGVRATATGAGPIPPAAGESIAVELLASDLASTRLSVSTMLVNTNDAITGVNGVDVSGMQPGDSVMLRTIAYDAGTEANSETGMSIPGPAGGGEGFNASRDDLFDRVAMHPGVVGQDDGFATSGLTSQHRFDNPVAAIRIERIE